MYWCCSRIGSNYNTGSRILINSRSRSSKLLRIVFFFFFFFFFFFSTFREGILILESKISWHDAKPVNIRYIRPCRLHTCQITERSVYRLYNKSGCPLNQTLSILLFFIDMTSENLLIPISIRVSLVSNWYNVRLPVVYSTDRSKTVVPVLVLLFGALWFILRGDLL